MTGVDLRSAVHHPVITKLWLWLIGVGGAGRKCFVL